MAENSHCSICIDDIAEKERNLPLSESKKKNHIKLKCGHDFHRSCMVAYLQNPIGTGPATCPNCRQSLGRVSNTKPILKTVEARSDNSYQRGDSSCKFYQTELTEIVVRDQYNDQLCNFFRKTLHLDLMVAIFAKTDYLIDKSMQLTSNGYSIFTKIIYCIMILQLCICVQAMHNYNNDIGTASNAIMFVANFIQVMLYIVSTHKIKKSWLEGNHSYSGINLCIYSGLMTVICQTIFIILFFENVTNNIYYYFYAIFSTMIVVITLVILYLAIVIVSMILMAIWILLKGIVINCLKPFCEGFCIVCFCQYLDHD